MVPVIVPHRAHSATGAVIRKTLANGLATYFAYDQAGRLTSLRNCTAAGAPLAYFDYSYDAASRITQVRRESGANVYYTYDDADRLTGERWLASDETELYAFAWDYDAVGNRTYQKRGTAETYYVYDAANELLRTHAVPADTWTYRENR